MTGLQVLVLTATLVIGVSVVERVSRGLKVGYVDVCVLCFVFLEAVGSCQFWFMKKNWLRIVLTATTCDVIVAGKGVYKTRCRRVQL